MFDHDHHPSHFPEEEDNFGGGLCVTMTTTPSLFHLRRRAFVKKAVYDHDHHPFQFPEEEESFSEEGCV